MKSKLCFSILAILLLRPLGVAFAQNRGISSNGAPSSLPLIDPTTGLPQAPAIPEWKDADWRDPVNILTNVFYNGLPLSDIAKDLRDRFKGEFDILLPAPTNGRPLQQGDVDWSQINVELQLRDVTASEVFNAMNLLFEDNQTPLRWELKVNGHRELALLRVLAEPKEGPSPGAEVQRRVYFLGNLIGDEKGGGMTMEQVVNDIHDVCDFGNMEETARVWETRDNSRGKIQYHIQSQLLVVTGTPSQIDFVEQTLKALQQKVDLARRSESKTVEGKLKPDEKKPGSAGN
ncbi:MAG TPA: hypothetical protein VG938_10735 [Verrucomicrobiae bacterium]|jgi:hypothetical protein|nr:hypothetical protein [Verrucomicrobiae bacterium]